MVCGLAFRIFRYLNSLKTIQSIVYRLLDRLDAAARLHAVPVEGSVPRLLGGRSVCQPRHGRLVGPDANGLSP